MIINFRETKPAFKLLKIRESPNLLSSGDHS